MIGAANHRSTIGAPVVFLGVGVHSGAPVRLEVLPRSLGTGVSFTRTDLPGFPSVDATWRSTGSLVLCTTLRGGGGAEVSTVEHLMAAFAGLGVDDAAVFLDGPEVPIMDGSAAPFVAALSVVGLRSSRVPRRAICVLRAVEVADGAATARIEPHDGFSVEYEIDYANPVIGRSRYSLEVGPASFRREMAPARTFGLVSDIERLRAAGLARGGSLDNAVVVGDEGVMNPGGLRFADEFARHKALDAVGDLALAGAPILGRFVGHRSGHALNAALLRALMSDNSAWCWRDASIQQGQRSVGRQEIRRAA